MTTSKQGLSKIDFTKLTSLPKFKSSSLVVRKKEFHYDQHVFVMTVELVPWNGWLAAMDASGKWYSGRPCDAMDTQAEIHDICKKVDAFIESELAAMNEPNWVDVKWTEVERLARSGASLQWLHSYSGLFRVLPSSKEESEVGIDGVRYQVDTRTVPIGVNLYEPEWVPVSWLYVDHLLFSGTTVEYHVQDTGEWVKKLNGPGFRADSYRGDKKTFPAGHAKLNISPEQTDAVNSRGSIRSLLEDRCPFGTDAMTAIRRLADILDERIK